MSFEQVGSINSILEAAKKTIGDELRSRLTKYTNEIIESIVVDNMLQWKFFLEKRGTPGELHLVIKDNREPPQNQ